MCIETDNLQKAMRIPPLGSLSEAWSENTTNFIHSQYTLSINNFEVYFISKNASLWSSKRTDLFTM